MTANEYMQLPDKRDLRVFPFTAKEEAVMDNFDKEGNFDKLPEAAATLIIKWHTVGNYEVSDQSLRSALIAIRPLLGSAPQAVADPGAWNNQHARDAREGRMTHSEKAALRESVMADSAKELQTLDKAIEEKIRKDVFKERCVQVEIIVVGHASGKPDYRKTFNARIEGWNKLKVDFPEYAQQIDSEIAKLQAKQTAF